MTGEQSDQVLELLAQAARSDRLLLFVGSGISSLPSWAELVADLNGGVPHTSDYPGEFSGYVERNGMRALHEFLERKLGMRPADVEMQIRLLLETRSTAIVSTNCDHIIETAAAHLGVPLKIFAEDSDLVDFHSTPCLRLVKLHGDLDRKESLVFTHDQYEDLPRSKPALIRTVVELFNSSRVLFLGFSMADPDFRQLMELTGNGKPDRVSQMIGLFRRAELGGQWRQLALDTAVRNHVPLRELSYEEFGDSPTDGLQNFLCRLKTLVSPASLPRLEKQCIIFTNGCTATLKTETTAYLANCLGIPVLATHRYGRCTENGLLDSDLRASRYAELQVEAENLLSRGFSVVLDGTFSDRSWREEIYRLAEQHEAHPIVIRTVCDDTAYIRSRLWRRRLDHSRSEHEVTKFENYQMTYSAVKAEPVAEDEMFQRLNGEIVTFQNHADRAVRVPSAASEEARVIAELIRISPLMSVEI
jgi:predicted kinase